MRDIPKKHAKWIPCKTSTNFANLIHITYHGYAHEQWYAGWMEHKLSLTMLMLHILPNVHVGNPWVVASFSFPSMFTSSRGWLPLWMLSNQSIIFHSCIKVESDQVAWVLHTEKFTTETGKGKGMKNSSQVNSPYFFLYKYTTAVCRQLLKRRNENTTCNN